MFNGREYEIYKNGRVFSKSFEHVDKMGKTRKFERKECIPSKNTSGYFELNIGGRNGERWLLHRLIANVWLDDHRNETINHINGNKGDNSVENLEWCSLNENIRKGYDKGLYVNNNSLHCKYLKWKNGHTCVTPDIKYEIIKSHITNKLTCEEISNKFGITIKQANNIISHHQTSNEELFLLTYHWESIIDELNRLREVYLNTRDDEIFQQIRCLLPCGHNIRFTYQLNYEVLRNMYHARKNHKLDEWRAYCKWIETLPYAKELICE